MKTARTIRLLLIGLCLTGGALVAFLPGGSFLLLEYLPHEAKLEQQGALDSRPTLSERKRKLRGELKMNAPDRFAEFHRAIRTRRGEQAPAYTPNYRVRELQKAWMRSGLGLIGKRASSQNVLPWKERGPSNVSGRARAILVDPEDPEHDTWFVGSAGGGVWKTDDAGQSWRELTRDLPNLATTSLAMPAVNPDIIYAGTGEGYGTFSFVYGQGIWKSIDKGESWTQLQSTTSDPAFTNTLRITVNPENENQVLAATSTGLRRSFDEESFIMRSTNGGVTWDRVYSSASRIEQVLAGPDNFQVQYATVNGKGILKSTDGGVNWTEIFEPFYNVGRLEMAVAPSDPSKLYVSAEIGFFQATLFLSSDAGDTWEVMDRENDSPPDWLGLLGWYSNAIAVDPFNADRVFVGGLDIYQFDMSATTFEQGHVKEVVEVDPVGLFRLDIASDAPAVARRLGQDTEINTADFIEVEVRWGPEKSQKAHRFVDKWAGEYRDYVDVAFEVWDVKNNRQLMVAYEDENKDNLWDISGALVDVSERIFILDEPYNASTPHTPTTENAFNRAHYVLTVISESDDELSHGPFPDASIRIIPEIRLFREAGVAQVTDGYSGDPILSKGVHVDHHQLVFTPSNSPDETPMLLDANDGGVAVSYDMGTSFLQTGDTFSQLFDGAGGSGRPFRGLNTAQFYGVDKMNGADRYVGGTQDNGSWVSPLLETNAEPWRLAPGGDGFEAVWHYTNPEWIIQSSQFNRMYRSINSGISWHEITPPGTAVFLTRIAKSNQDPNLLFSATPSGVVRSENFGTTWQRINLLEVWPTGGSPTVRISLASPDVVWAGTELGGPTPFFVSVDRGISFEAIQSNGIPDLGAITNIATHPFEPHTAYVLFSFANAPKVLKTTDLGQNWVDLSGFESGEESLNGFPDVAVYSLLVMPYDDQILWAGTEIGIFESTDGGQNWHFTDSGFPAVAVWQMRIVNDQIVVATHGRGVWSVQMPELASYEPADVTLSPTILATRGGADGRVEMQVDLREVYDSTLVFAEGQRVARIAGNAERGVEQIFINLYETLPGAVNQETVQLSAWGYISGQALPSTAKSKTVYDLEPAQLGFATSFETAGGDFVLDGFVISQEDGFNNPALHSVHPYPNFQDATATLRTPVQIDEADPLLHFDEVARVEAGEAGELFGTTDFYDYVVVEGSTDLGITWQPLADGYDIRYAEIWGPGEDLAQPPTAAHFVNHTINLEHTFDIGDKVLIRFRMVTDNAVSGWGWVIDNLRIQETLPTSTEQNGLLPTRYALSPNYPNPFKKETTITYSLPEPADVDLSVYDIHGRLIQQLVYTQRQPAGKYNVQWDGTTPWGTPVASGVYFYRLDAGAAFQKTQQLVKVN